MADIPISQVPNALQPLPPPPLATVPNYFVDLSTLQRNLTSPTLSLDAFNGQSDGLHALSQGFGNVARDLGHIALAQAKAQDLDALAQTSNTLAGALDQHLAKMPSLSPEEGVSQWKDTLSSLKQNLPAAASQETQQQIDGAFNDFAGLSMVKVADAAAQNQFAQAKANVLQTAERNYLANDLTNSHALLEQGVRYGVLQPGDVPAQLRDFQSQWEDQLLSDHLQNDPYSLKGELDRMDSGDATANDNVYSFLSNPVELASWKAKADAAVAQANYNLSNTLDDGIAAGKIITPEQVHTMAEGKLPPQMVQTYADNLIAPAASTPEQKAQLGANQVFLRAQLDNYGQTRPLDDSAFYQLKQQIYQTLPTDQRNTALAELNQKESRYQQGERPDYRSIALGNASQQIAQRFAQGALTANAAQTLQTGLREKFRRDPESFDDHAAIHDWVRKQADAQVRVQQARNFYAQNDESVRPQNASAAIVNAVRRGWVQGQIAMELQEPSPDPARIVNLQRQVTTLKPTQDFEQTWSDKIPARESLKAFLKNPALNLTQLIAEGLGEQVRTQGAYIGKVPERAGEGMLIGSTGLVLGPEAGVPMIIAGGEIGAATGFAESSMLATHASEYASSFLGSLAENGVDITNAQSLRDAFGNPELMARIRAQAERKAVPPGIVAGILAAIGGRLFSGPAKTAGGKIAQGVAEMGAQTLGSMFGEYLGQKNETEKVTSPKAIVATGAGQATTHVANIAAGKFSQTVHGSLRGITLGRKTDLPSSEISIISLLGGKSVSFQRKSLTINNNIKWVKETLPKSAALNYEKGTPGWIEGKAPQLSASDTEGTITAKFDGVSENTMIDSKLSIKTYPKVELQMLRQSAVAAENDYTVIWQVPTQNEAKRAISMANSLGIKNIKIVIRPITSH